MQTTELPKSPRTAPKAARRRQLIDATLESIASNGVSGTTMAAVTGAAGLSLGIVSLHFQSKENLLRATLEELTLEHRAYWVEAQSDPDLTPAEKLWAIMEAHFHPIVCTPTKLAVWFAFFGEAKHRAAYHSLARRFDIERASTVERLCAEIAAEGGYDDIDPLALMKSLECFADGLWLSIMMYPDWMTPDEAKARIRDMLAASFPAHFPRLGPASGEPRAAPPSIGRCDE